MGDFFMAVSAIGAVILVLAVISYRRAKASLGEAPAVLKRNDWLYFGIATLVITFIVFGFIYVANLEDKRKKESIDEKLRIEEFSYNGHQYIKFKTNRTFDGISVVHDPNCECQIKKDSINI